MNHNIPNSDILALDTGKEVVTEQQQLANGDNLSS